MWFKPFSYSGLKLIVVRNKIIHKYFLGIFYVPGPWGINKCFKTIKQTLHNRFSTTREMLQITVGNPRFPQKIQLFTGNMILELTLREAKDICQTDMTLYGTWTALQRHRSINCTIQLVSSLQEFTVNSSVGLQSLFFSAQHITSTHDNLREH